MRRVWICVMCAILLFGMIESVSAESYLQCPKKANVVVGKTKSLSIKTNATGLEIFSKDTSIVTVEGKKIRGVKAGKTDVVVMAYFDEVDAQSIQKTISVTVRQAVEKKSDKPDPIKKFALPTNFRNSIVNDANQLAFAVTDLAIRDDANTKIGVLGERAIAAYLGDVENGRCRILDPQGIEGTVSANSLVPFGFEHIAQVNAASLNVRFGPGMEYAACDTLQNGDTVPVLASAGNWSLVDAGGSVGYVTNNYLTANVETSASPGTTSGITIPSDTLTVAVGESKEIDYTFNDPTAERAGLKNNWTITNTKIATVDGDTVTGVGIGSTYVYATDYTDKVYICAIIVEPAKSELAVLVPSTEITTTSGKVLSRRLIVRSGPGISYAELGKISQGDVVEIVETVNAWHKIVFGTGFGYVASQYIVKV